MDIKNNKNHNVLFILSVFFLLLIMAGLFYYFNSSLSKKIKSNSTVDAAGQSIDNQIKQIKKDNENAVRDAMYKSDTALVKISENDHIQGDINAPVQIIVYDDLDNEFSAYYNKYLKEAIDYFGEKIVIAYRHFPMRSHSNSLFAAQAGECAGEQGNFLEMRDAILSAKENGSISTEYVGGEVDKLGLDLEKFNSCLEGKKYINEIQNDIDEAARLSVIGAPTTFLNKRILPGAFQFEDFRDSAGIDRKGLKSLIEEEL